MDKRIPKMQETLEEAMLKIQNLYIQATGGNIVNVYETIVKLQIVYNTLKNMQEEQQETEMGGNDDGNGNERKVDIE